MKQILIYGSYQYSCMENRLTENISRLKWFLTYEEAMEDQLNQLHMYPHVETIDTYEGSNIHMDARERTMWPDENSGYFNLTGDTMYGRSDSDDE